MVVLDKRLILTPEIRSFFDLTIIDPSVGLVEVDKFAALGGSVLSRLVFSSAKTLKKKCNR